MPARHGLTIVGLIMIAALFGCGHHPGGDHPDADGTFVPDGGVCPGAGEQSCGNSCVNTQINPDNCGACGNVCGTGQVCLSSGCANSCPAPLSACDRTCVDRSSDNANCGTCGHACGTGTGCVEGACVAEVAVGPDPAKCVNGGPPISVDPGTGTPTCTGNLVGATFTYGLCTCQNVGVPAISSLFRIDAYDSTKGPYKPGGLGGSCGANGSIRMSSEFDVSGDLRTTGSPGLTIGGATKVGQSLHVANRLDVQDVLTVGLDGFVGSFAGSAPATITHDLHTPNCSTVPGSVSVGGTCVSGPINVTAPCSSCQPNEVKIPALVTYYSDPAHNDNALIGLDPAVYATPAAAARLELPCGYYYLSSINGSSARVIGVHGRTAIFVGASINASASITFTLTPGATLDVFVAGSMTTSAELHTGTPAYPSHSRFWVSGNVLTSANGILNGLFYDATGTFTATSDLEMYGSIYTNNYDGQSATLIHYDQAAAQAGQECPTTPPPTCGSAYGQMCTTDSDCCQPLYCLADHTCGYMLQ